MTLSKIVDLMQVKEWLPAFSQSDSFAVKYFVDELSNTIQMQDMLMLRSKGYIDANFVGQLHV